MPGPELHKNQRQEEKSLRRQVSCREVSCQRQPETAALEAASGKSEGGWGGRGEVSSPRG